ETVRFPSMSSLELTWERVARRGADVSPAALQDLIDRGARYEALVPAPGGAFRALWVDVDRGLVDRGAPQTLRDAHERAAVRKLGHALRTGDTEALTAIYRLAPWSASVHAALADHAERELRRGRAGIARRLFQDVYDHATAPRLRARAQAGLLCCGAASSAAKGPLPWMGATAEASAIAEKLTAHRERTAEPSRIRTLAQPPLPAWPNASLGSLPEEARCVLPIPTGVLQSAQGRLLYSGPRLLACTGANLGRPLWTRTTARQDGLPKRSSRDTVQIVPGPFRPAFDGRRVYARWGLERGGLRPDALAAFDADTGAMLWTTRDDATWDPLTPVGDPAAADGRVYALATREGAGMTGQVFLACLDADRGATLWQRPLGSQSVALPIAEGAPYRLRGTIDLATHAAPLVVRDGSVFCLSHMGFVARCDARDGMVEWARAYPRVRAGVNVARVLRRQGAPPLLVGDTVVCVPRDYDGAFAVHRSTGKLLWDAPFVPTEWVGGSAGDVVIVGDGHRVLAMAVSDGAVRWERSFPSGVRGMPCVVGASVWVTSGDRIVRLAAGSGKRLDVKTQPGVQALAVTGETLVALTESRATRPPAPKPRAAAPLALPLERAWRLQGAQPRIWTPEGDRIFLHAGGVLECVALRPEGGVRWSNLLPDGFHDLLWRDGSLIAVYPRHVTALDAATGERRWRTELPFVASVHRLCGNRLFVGHLQGDVRAAMLDAASGRLLWHREFTDALWRERADVIEHVAWDGERLHLMSSRFRFDRKTQPGALIVRPDDGRVEGLRPYPGEQKRWPRAFVFGDGIAFGAVRGEGILALALRDARIVKLHAALAKLDGSKVEKLALQPPWLVVRWRAQYPQAGWRTWVLRPDDATFLVRRPHPGWVRDGVVYDAMDRQGAVSATDLGTRKAVTYRCPPLEDRSSAREVIHCRADGDTLWVLSAHALSHRPEDQRLRLDTFDRAAGTHRDTQVLAGILAQGAKFLWRKDLLVVRNDYGLYGLTTAATERRALPVHLAYRTPRRIVVDGSPEEWAGQPHLPMGRGRLSILHDAEHVYLLLDTVHGHPTVRVGSGGAGDGDRIELGLTTERGACRLEIGVDPRGRTAWKSPGPEPLPEGVRARMRHDPIAQRTVCEVAIPLASIMRSYGVRDRLGLSVAVWDDRQDGRPPVRLCQRGEGLDGAVIDPSLHQPVHLYPRSLTQDAGLSALVHELPDLPASLAHFRRHSAIRAPSKTAQRDYGWDFIRRHPRSAAAEALLLEMAISGQRADMLARAAEAGVPAPVRERIARSASTAISQWVYVTEGQGPRALVLEFRDELGAAGRDDWGHRAVWGKIPIHWAVPPAVIGPIEPVPRGRWYELWTPLHRVNMHDRALCGINFVQHGGGRVVWDRSAVVVDGKETVFLDDAVPPGTTARTWEWVTAPVHTGAQAHTHPPPKEQNAILSHTVAEMDEPVVAHLSPPLDRPYLSQWVYLDPARPP
ncbi:PQQ-binding-like beta-propeller repeat protein, partial [bacterium]|nr:PQQ-binding-like beta-propeller repeat protein [bacterium]